MWLPAKMVISLRPVQGYQAHSNIQMKAASRKNQTKLILCVISQKPLGTFRVQAL